MLETLGVPHFLPLKTEVRQWSDREQKVSVPLFDGYLFVRIDASKESRLRVLKTSGVIGLVGNQTGPVPIPHQQIEAIRTVIDQRLECSVLTVLEEGEHVRVVRGPLTGLEGRLVGSNSTSRLMISIEMIHRSLALKVYRHDVEPMMSDAMQLVS
jgi:transcription antitermination factor NusG